jgi:hypothetical protein
MLLLSSRIGAWAQRIGPRWWACAAGPRRARRELSQRGTAWNRGIRSGYGPHRGTVDLRSDRLRGGRTRGHRLRGQQRRFPDRQPARRCRSPTRRWARQQWAPAPSAQDSPTRCSSQQRCAAAAASAPWSRSSGKQQFSSTHCPGSPSHASSYPPAHHSPPVHTKHPDTRRNRPPGTRRQSSNRPASTSPGRNMSWPSAVVTQA